MENILREIFNFLSIEFTVMLTATIPVIELRGAIPVGISLGLSPLHATIIGFIGSMIPVPFILFTIRPIFNYLKKTSAFRNIINRLTTRSVNQAGGKIEKYGLWGLAIFVAIPLPGTGVWSGSLAAAFLDMGFKRAFPAIFFGNLIAAVLIMAISSGAFSLFR